MNPHKTIIQNACAILLILSSIALAFMEANRVHDIASGILLYIAQAFLLAASIFGLDVYVHHITKILNAHDNSRNKEQQSSQHSERR